MDAFRPLIGLALLLGIGWLCCSNRRRIDWRTIGSGLLLVLALGLVVFKVPKVYPLLERFSFLMKEFLDHTYAGTAFVFGSLGQPADKSGPAGFCFAFSSLATIIFVSAVMAILYHLGIMQAVVWVLARGLRAVLRISGAESLSVAANIFVGQTEAPLVIKPYFPRMTRSEMMAVMVGGFSTIAGSLFATYMGFVGEANQAHILTASFLAAPATFVFAKLVEPETGNPETGGRLEFKVEREADNAMEALAAGVVDGGKLWFNVIVMLVAFLALLSALNWPLQGIVIDGEPLSIERILGWICFPVAWCLGVPFEDCGRFGTLIGIKTGANEFVAYLRMEEMMKAGLLTAKSQLMATFALCGFANFASIGIQIGGMAPLAPERRAEISALALRAMLAGTLANLLTAIVAGVLGGA